MSHAEFSARHQMRRVKCFNVKPTSSMHTVIHYQWMVHRIPRLSRPHQAPLLRQSMRAHLHLYGDIIERADY